MYEANKIRLSFSFSSKTVFSFMPVITNNDIMTISCKQDIAFTLKEIRPNTDEHYIDYDKNVRWRLK